MGLEPWLGNRSSYSALVDSILVMGKENGGEMDEDGFVLVVVVVICSLWRIKNNSSHNNNRLILFI